MNSISRVQPCVTEAQWNKFKGRKNLVFVHFATVRHRRPLHPTTHTPVSPLPSVRLRSLHGCFGAALACATDKPYPIRRPGDVSTCVDTARRHGACAAA